jgi:hypothetical protein
VAGPVALSRENSSPARHGEESSRQALFHRFHINHHTSTMGISSPGGNPSNEPIAL